MSSRPPSSRHALLTVVLLAAFGEAAALAQQAPRAATFPRTPDGKPNLQGIWQVRGNAASDLSAKGIVEGGTIPYLPAAATKRQQNFTNRKTADPLAQCYMPGVPRIMYMEYPFQIFQTPEHIAITFEWSQVYRLIYLNGKPSLHEVVDSWMGDSRARWEGDTLVVQVTGQTDKTWFDLAGNFHSDELKVTERYTMLDADTIRYEAAIDDPKTFTKSWKISMPLARQKNVARLLEYQCQDKAEEASGAFERDPRTWYPDPGAPPSPLGKPATMPQVADLPPVKPGTNIRRGADGKPDITGYFQSNAGGANYGLEKHARDEFTPATRGVVIDPADGTLPYQPWARAERINRELPYRGYDDPTAHCFVAGVPRSMYVPSPLQILQPPGYVVLLFERMSWRIIPLDSRPHLADNVRLWQGDSVGHWEGDTLVVDTTNMNGKTWMNEVGDVVSYAEHIVERFTPIDAKQVNYRATVTDPIVYTRPWTIEIPLNSNPDELLEVACHEDNGDLQNLKAVRDEYRAQQKKGK
jgi:hypothetical protein